MNNEREEEQIKTYGTLVAQEIVSANSNKFASFQLALIETMLVTAFTAGALYGLKRGEEITQRVIIENFSKSIATA